MSHAKSTVFLNHAGSTLLKIVIPIALILIALILVTGLRLSQK
jgi:hypothetical protein